MRLKRLYERHSYECGMVYGRLTLTGKSHLSPMYGQLRRAVEAVCQCGIVRNYVFSSLTEGETKSCGCLRVDVARKMMTIHGLSKHPLFEVHQAMKKRCYVASCESYPDYGRRGITVCEEWLDDFIVFYEWSIENGYESGLSLDRKDNDKNYTPDNCHFTNRPAQNRNTRRNINITAFGETKCLFDWGKDPRCSVNEWGLRSRLVRGTYTDMEKMITDKPKDRKEVARNSKVSVNVTAFGETKCLTDWAKDERCVVGFDRLRDRIAEKWEHLAAITTYHKDKKDVDLTAFGETKSMANWLRDERCVVKVDALRDRVRAGWKHEDCISIPPKTRSKNK